MSEACGQANMTIREFWDSTPREVFNKIKGFFALEKMRIDNEWEIARAMTYNISASMIGSDKVDFYRMSYFPLKESPHRPKMDKSQVQAIIKKMDAHMKDGKGKVFGTTRELRQWAQQ